jgi:hypothetical protein
MTPALRRRLIIGGAIALLLGVALGVALGIGAR